MAEKTRCWWPGEDPLYLAYHDKEWGVPEYDPRALYEKLVLDGFQAGLSWITILRKRENFRKAFHDFTPEKIARYGGRDIDRLLKNEGIIRSRAKIEATIKGAKLWLEIEEKEPGGFRDLICPSNSARPTPAMTATPIRHRNGRPPPSRVGTVPTAKAFRVMPRDCMQPGPDEQMQPPCSPRSPQIARRPRSPARAR